MNRTKRLVNKENVIEKLNSIKTSLQTVDIKKYMVYYIKALSRGRAVW